ncbi:MAG: motility protein A [Aquificae bacterium]|nr:motility protein A [Aquificota bacterium]
MDVGTLVGVAGAFLLILISILIGGSLSAFINIPSVFIVIGGGLASAMGSFPLKDFIRGLLAVRKAFLWKAPDLTEVIETIGEIASKVRKEGILSLESDIELYYQKDPLLGDMIRMLVDGIDISEIRSTAQTALAQTEEELSTEVAVWEKLADLFPAFGMIGTLIGLIQMLRNLNDPSALGPGMAVALITTLYGAILANAFALPVANKLKKIKDTQLLIKHIYLEAIEKIQKGENPNVIKQEVAIMLGVELPQEV